MLIPVTLSPPAIQLDALNNRLHLWLERIFGYLTTAAISIYYLMLFLVKSFVVIVTLGAPYLQYRLYRNDGNMPHSSEKYSQMVKGLEMLWDQYSNFLLPILPALFTMVSLSGLSVCSVASFAAMMTFAVGSASVITKIIFKAKVNLPHNEHAINEWQQASEKSWHKVPNKSFWILFSLPTVSFVLSTGLFILTIVLTISERLVAGTPSRLEVQSCASERLQALKYTFLAVLVATVTHFPFVIIKLHFMTAPQTIDSTSAA